MAGTDSPAPSAGESSPSSLDPQAPSATASAAASALVAPATAAAPSQTGATGAQMASQPLTIAGAAKRSRGDETSAAPSAASTSSTAPGGAKRAGLSFSLKGAATRSPSGGAPGAAGRRVVSGGAKALPGVAASPPKGSSVFERAQAPSRGVKEASAALNSALRGDDASEAGGSNGAAASASAGKGKAKELPTDAGAAALDEAAERSRQEDLAALLALKGDSPSLAPAHLPAPSSSTASTLHAPRPRSYRHGSTPPPPAHSSSSRSSSHRPAPALGPSSSSLSLHESGGLPYDEGSAAQYDREARAGEMERTREEDARRERERERVREGNERRERAERERERDEMRATRGARSPIHLGGGRGWKDGYDDSPRGNYGGERYAPPPRGGFDRGHGDRRYGDGNRWPDLRSSLPYHDAQPDYPRNGRNGDHRSHSRRDDRSSYDGRRRGGPDEDDYRPRSPKRQRTSSPVRSADKRDPSRSPASDDEGSATPPPSRSGTASVLDEAARKRAQQGLPPPPPASLPAKPPPPTARLPPPPPPPAVPPAEPMQFQPGAPAWEILKQPREPDPGLAGDEARGQPPSRRDPYAATRANPPPLADYNNNNVPAPFPPAQQPLPPPPPPPPAAAPIRPEPLHAPLHPTNSSGPSRHGSNLPTVSPAFAASGQATPAAASATNGIAPLPSAPIDPGPPSLRTSEAAQELWVRAPSPVPPEPVSAAPSSSDKQYIGSSHIREYTLQEKLGEGTFGVVYKGVRGKQGVVVSELEREEEDRLVRERGLRVRKGDVVALKQIIFHNEGDGLPITSVREIRILKMLDHPNVVPVVDMAYEPADSASFSHGKTYMVFPYMDHDLAGLLENARVVLEESHIKQYAKQLLEGTAYLHKNGILHRDMKAANLLINNEGRLMIADFGLARSIHSRAEKREQYTGTVVTRWYRPPELLLGERCYHTPVDMWGVGCVIAEMYHRKPIFPGESDLDQARRIFEACGPPTEQSMPGWRQLTGVEGFKDQQWPDCGRSIKANWAAKSKSDLFGDLIDKLLVLDPEKRLTADEALDHDWFWSEPFPADPADMPKHMSSHEYDKRRRIEAQQAFAAAQQPAQLPPPQGMPHNGPPPPRGYPPVPGAYNGPPVGPYGGPPPGQQQMPPPVPMQGMYNGPPPPGQAPYGGYPPGMAAAGGYAGAGGPPRSYAAAGKGPQTHMGGGGSGAPGGYGQGPGWGQQTRQPGLASAQLPKKGVNLLARFAKK
ncbi:uncharacterized protein JCM10292_001366 [Rhodotorula paludigena]|uniref:uncharacterized protein n=1 Tax=Rhodotorula paludigena TaxID=86838 RepID=UPI003175108B